MNYYEEEVETFDEEEMEAELEADMAEEAKTRAFEISRGV